MTDPIDVPYEDLSPHDQALLAYADLYMDYMHHRWKLSPEQEAEYVRLLKGMEEVLDSNKP